jgi:SH3-like domain-containing protein
MQKHKIWNKEIVMVVRPLTKSIPMSLLASVLALTAALAGEHVSVIKDGANLRSAPKATAGVLFELPAGYPLEVLSKDGQWLKVNDYEGDKGYIQESLVNKSPHVIVKVKECKVRSGPGANEKIVGSGAKDVIFVKGEQKGDWIKVSRPELSGWVHKDLVWP